MRDEPFLFGEGPFLFGERPLLSEAGGHEGLPTVSHMDDTGRLGYGVSAMKMSRLLLLSPEIRSVAREVYSR